MNNSVKSAARILDILEIMTVSPEALGVSALARRLSLPKSSTAALLNTLAARGYVVRDGTAYRLKAAFREGGWAGGDMARLMRFAPAAMKKAVERTRESAFLGVLTLEQTVRYVSKVVSPQEVRYDGGLQHDRPAYCTSIGQVFLASFSDAQLDEYLKAIPRTRISSATVTDVGELRRIIRTVRERGYAESRNGHVEGASGVAAAILNEDGAVVAAITLAAPTARFDREYADLVAAVRDASAEVTRSFRHGSGVEAPQRAQDTVATLSD